MPYKSGVRTTTGFTLGSVFLVAALALACAPRPAEQPTPSPATTAATAATADASEPGEPGACAVDADCVPASCCHASTCAPVGEKPDCAAVSCTMDCQPNTMDCGGRCACEAGSCKAILGAP